MKRSLTDDLRQALPRALIRTASAALAAAVGLALAFGTAEAQTETTIAGVVRGQGGLALADVRVIAGVSASMSDQHGRFTVRVRPGSPVTLTFSRLGYLHESVRAAPLRSGEQREIAVTLVALYTLDAVTVTTERERPLLNTEDASTGGTIERAEMEGLPTDARRALTLAFSVPGVVPAAGFFGDAPPLSIAGGNALYSQYTLDGMDNNEGFLGGPRVELPLAALSRLEVLANGYPAAFGRSPYGVVEMETRAGGDSWSGEGFLFHRPGMPLDARPKYTSGGTDPEGFQRLQIGGTVGGPLALGRTFLFATGEYGDEREDRIGSTARAAFLGTELRETGRAFARLDHGWSQTQTSTLRFALHDVRRAGQGGGVIVPEADITTRRIGRMASVTHQSVLGGGIGSNSVAAQIGTFRWDFPPTLSDLATPQVIVVAPDSLTVEAVVGSSNFVFDERELQVQLRDVLEMRIGRGHTLRAGADLVSSRFELAASGTNPRGAYTVINDGNIHPSGAFLSIRDIPGDVRVLRYVIDAKPQQVDLTQTLWGAFIEDRWRLSSALVLNLGLRWDYDDITSRGESTPDLNNLQPRVSFNWYATPSSVLRGGAGVYTGRFPYAIYSDAVQFGPDGNAVVTLEGDRFPPPPFGAGPTPEQLQAIPGTFPPREIRRAFAHGLQQPQSVQSTLGYQRQLGEEWGVSVDAVWVETYNLPRSWDLNAISRPLASTDTVHRPVEFGDAARPTPPEPGSFRRLTTTETGGRARYLGLHTRARRRISRTLTLEGSWVLSRARNDTEDINFNAAHANDFAAEWADAVNDRRHQLSLRGLFTRNRLRFGAVADYQTGTPVNRIAHFRDLDGSGPVYGDGFIGNYDRFPGVRRNAERLPSAFRIDANAAYLIPARGSQVELRIDGFNLLNSTLVSGYAHGMPGGGPRTQVGRPGDPMVFGAAAPPRQFQLSLRWLW